MFYNSEIEELNLAELDSEIKRKYFVAFNSLSFISKNDFKDYVHTVLNQPHYLDVFQAFGKWQYDLRSESISLPILKKNKYSSGTVNRWRFRYRCFRYQSYKIGLLA